MKILGQYQTSFFPMKNKYMEVEKKKVKNEDKKKAFSLSSSKLMKAFN